MTTEQFELLLGVLNRVADNLGMTARSGSGPTAVVPDSPYISPDVPDGYDTVLGYLQKTHPEVLDLIDEPISGTQRDGAWLQSQAFSRKLGTVTVEAPQAAKEAGLVTMRAYPLALLEERFN
ncbi:hypothetical protein CYK37_30220 [Mesorhizobium loti]|nr:hypothetical protein [Mesorhizobium loti]PLP55567.1 hypothetical protein CYK37_30220 [Mesorhizobium loti]